MKPKISVIVPAAGAGTRVGGTKPKQFLPLGGVPMLKRTLAALENAELIDEIAVAVPGGYEDEVRAYGFKKLRYVVNGRETRGESVMAALECLSDDTDIVLIHDGCRPFVTQKIISDVIEAVVAHGAAVASVPVTDTIKQADNSGFVTATPNRALLWQAQTPQGFTYDVVRRAYTHAATEGFLSQATDDSVLAEYIGEQVFIVPSSPANIKITNPEDFASAPAFLPEKSMKEIKIYTDGACSGNPGPGGYGAILVHGEHRKEISGGDPQTTNNRMELMGVIKGLEMLKKPCEVEVYTDSRYIVDSVEKGWVYNWQKKKWMRTKTEPTPNADLWQELLALLAKHKVTFHWVKGHAGHPENERCDELARSAVP